MLGVTHTAVQLAERHGADTTMAAIAGLVHDRSKWMKPEAIEAELKDRGIGIPAEDRDYPAIWHGLHAAAWLRQDAGLGTGPEIDELAIAIQHHSTAEAGLGPIGKILFIADYLEPGRYFDGIEKLRQLSRENLDEAYKSCLATKCTYMLQIQGKKIHPRARRALESCGIGLAPSAAIPETS